MRLYHASDLTSLHDDMTRSLLLAPRDELDMVTSVDVQIHNVIGQADTLNWDFDLKDMWLTKSRWSMMCRQYLDPEELAAWLERCTTMIGTKGRGIALMRTKTVKPRGGAATGHTNKETRRWGSCMIALSYKALPQPQITLYSRTSYLGYIGALDLTVAQVAGRYLARELGLSLDDIRFVWMNEAIQWHNFKSLAYVLNHPNEKKRKAYRRLMTKSEKKLTEEELDAIATLPGVGLSRKWLRKVMAEDKAGVTYGDMTYNTYRRIRRRWHTEVLGYEKAQEFEGWSYYKQGEKAGEQKEFFKAYQPLPSVPASTLDFSCLGLPYGKDYGGEFIPGAVEEDDDDE